MLRPVMLAQLHRNCIINAPSYLFQAPSAPDRGWRQRFSLYHTDKVSDRSAEDVQQPVNPTHGGRIAGLMLHFSRH